MTAISFQFRILGLFQLLALRSSPMQSRPGLVLVSGFEILLTKHDGKKILKRHLENPRYDDTKSRFN